MDWQAYSKNVLVELYNASLKRS